MKLSEKGFEKILDTCHFDEDRATYALNYSWPKKDYHFEIQGTEFEPDDFDGGCFQNGKDHVTLSVEEAKNFLGWLHNSQWKHRTDLEYAEDWQRDWIRYLKERIEQAEGK